ncbi:MFS transporter [Actinoplanes sp. NPDC026619]|uniref:MFS transporter n=1 Tax=Actinoplanes sp. NPDC026619 TaxID=3155798 RepID=UPI0033DC6193
MLGQYRRLFSAEGTVAFTLAGVVARYPMGMYGVSILLLMVDTSGSYATAGRVAAVGLVAMAVCAPLVGRLVDRYGQAKVAVPATATSVAACTGTVLCAQYGAPMWAIYVTYALSATCPFVGTMARARWVRIYRKQPDMMHTANAFERIVDEIVFITGPAAAGLLCGAIGPAAGLYAANTLLLAGTLLFAAQRRTQPTPVPIDKSQKRVRLLTPGITATVALFPILGIALGSMELVTVNYVASHSSRSYSGIFLALIGLGSCLTGLYFGTLKLKSDLRRRTLAVSAILCGCLMPIPLLLDGNLVLFGAWAFVVGSAFAPFLITTLGLLQQLTPEERMNEGMSLVDASLVGGQAIGLLTSGVIAAHYGGTTGFLIVSAAGLLTLLVATGGARWSDFRR